LKSTALFVALVGFAVINTIFLGLYLSSGNTTGAPQEQVTATSTLQSSHLVSSSTTMMSTNSQTQESAYSGTSTATTAITSTPTFTYTTMTETPSSGTATQSISAETSTTSTTSSAPAATLDVTTSESSEAAQSESMGSTSSQTTTEASGSPTTASSASTSSQTYGTVISTSTSQPVETPTTTVGETAPTALVLANALVKFFEQHSLILAPGSWFAVGGMWIWRGRMRAKWTNLGFDSDVFTLFVRMKGAKTRMRLLDALNVPKDRLQLAGELGLDWKSVDRHVAVMKKYGFVSDKVAYGRVKLYQLTPMGVSLLNLMQELSKEEKQEPSLSSVPLEGES